MRWIAIFTDTPTMLAVRAQQGQAHLDFLARHKTEIVLAGGCRSDAGGDYVGGLWVLEVSDRARAVALIEQDPYYLSGARQYVLRTWGKAFEEDRVVL
ncbi:YciI-like protein [Comamonas aquatica]|jgi:hypothetical protein|uniref:YciI family protein n=1 Tax=Comamonas aquatica TaxID=225991 RepID=UPI001EF2C925|nr:YciI family protein [Comamonas aquatica]CAB5685819.1 YciI-like protein [Comamonas aquatica]CAC9215848.1 YciI-like protein [Comamonas aquatica]